MLTAAIEGIGVVGGFGCGIDDLKQALAVGKRLRQSVRIPTENGEVTVPALLADTASLENYVPKKALRRLDHYTRLALLGGFLALDDAGRLTHRPGRMGIILATGYGATCNTSDFKHSLTGDSDIFGSPTKFSNSVHNAAAAHLAILLDEKGPNLSISQFDMSVAQALLTGLIWLSEGRVDTVLAGGVDEYCNILGHYWRSIYGDRSTTDEINWPTDPAHAVIGEGAAFFVMSTTKKFHAKHGILETVRIGNTLNPLAEITDRSAVILGADGYSDCLTRYPQVVPKTADAGVYTGIYGGIPIGPAFDLAVATVSLTDGVWYPAVAPGRGFNQTFGLSHRETPLETDRIHCLKLGSAGDYGLLTLAGSWR